MLRTIISCFVMPTHRAFTRSFSSGLTKGLAKVFINALTRDLTSCDSNRHTKPRPASHRTHIVSCQRTLYSYLFGCVGLLGWTIAEGSNNTLEEVTVTATLLNEASPALSATVLAEPQMQQRGAVHLENLISLAPNVASSSGASRNRFFQIRGIGERSQFVEPINPSVGILLDGIDLSGSGGALTLYDLQQVEILRGPQGTLMGANALAGLIALRSTGTDSAIREITAGLENNGGRHVGARLGGTLADGLSGRMAFQQFQSDGFVNNQWLDRDDTNQRDELTGRAALRWQAAKHALEVAAYYTDIDNGYDAFSLDNTRSTLSDEPGEDDLTLKAARLNWDYRGNAYKSLLQMSHAKTLSTYSYDEDWSYVGIAPGWEYSSFDQYRRDRSMSSAEWRLLSDTPTPNTWALGVYVRKESEALRRDYTYLSSPFHSDIDTLTTALFGQINHDINEQLAGFVGARVEQRNSDYVDNAGVDRSFDLSYWTGRAGLIWQYQSDQQLYVTVSRGARAGGPNARLLASIDALPAANQDALSRLGTYEEETLLSLELGWVTFWPEYQLRSQLSLFAMDRQDQQAKASLVIPRSDGSTAFIDYTDNAAAGIHRGLEWEATWRPTESLTWNASIGLLDAYFDEYISATGEDLSGRSQPQSPEWQYSLGATWALHQRVSLHLEAVGSDDYFFSDRHTVNAPETHQINASLSGQHRAWQWTLWGRNLTDKNTFTRGFGTFGNDPRKEYRLEAYRQYGEPRMVGFTLQYRFTERPK